ncbi:MAG: hypothetical protein ACLTLL_07425 [Acutalibacteraceae bacterium]
MAATKLFIVDIVAFTVLTVAFVAVLTPFATALVIVFAICTVFFVTFEETVAVFRVVSATCFVSLAVILNFLIGF